MLAGLEKRDVLFGDRNAVAGPRVAACPGFAALDRKRAKAAQLNPITARQRGSDLVKYRRDDDLDIALVQMRIGFSKPLYELRFRHRDRRPLILQGDSLPKPPAGVKQGSAAALAGEIALSPSPRLRPGGARD